MTQRHRGEENRIKQGGTLHLLPNFLGDPDPFWITAALREAVGRCEVFIVESQKMSRRMIKSIMPEKDLAACEFFVLRRDLSHLERQEMIQPLEQGRQVGLVSDAGLPAIADPGASIVALAHRRGLQIRPYVGPSSIMMALMASGLNGQQFTFHGYLPHPKKGLKQRLRQLQQIIFRDEQTQLFIETPYRNEALLTNLLAHLDDGLFLCIACDITLPTEEIHCRTIAEWKKSAKVSIDKRPCVFVLGLPASF